MSAKKVVVLAGGYSPEREVSLTSGSLIANALIRKGYHVLLLDSYLGMKDLTNLEEKFMAVPEYHHSVSETVPDLERLKRDSGNGEVLIGPHVLDICRLADYVFLALHGAMGENGQLQATLDSHGIRYTGSGYIGSALAMDKDLSKRLFVQSGIPTAKWIYGDIHQLCAEDIEREIGLPCVVKPCSCGSSVGVSIVETHDQLIQSIREVAPWESKLLVEKKITGREITVGVLDGHALPCIEIRPKHGFYDYKNKYQSGLTEEICPAPLTAEQAEKVSRISEKAFCVLRMESYARFDYIMTDDNEFYCLEANSLPGMTPTSLLPQMAQAAGMDYDTLCETILLLKEKK